jgi:hypothetical protein
MNGVNYKLMLLQDGMAENHFIMIFQKGMAKEFIVGQSEVGEKVEARLCEAAAQPKRQGPVRPNRPAKQKVTHMGGRSFPPPAVRPRGTDSTRTPTL